VSDHSSECEIQRFDPDVGAEVLVGLGPYDAEAHAEEPCSQR